MFIKAEGCVVCYNNYGGKYKGWRGGTVYYDEVKTSDLGIRACVLKRLHARMIFGPFEKKIHEGNIWIGHRALIYTIN